MIRQKDLTARLAALVADQERLLEIIRKEKAELVRMHKATFSTSLTSIQSR
jgi:hypothetical protein